ncbi:hypothetical protein LGK95_13055 [Clostridium algoriphilum]|uniref:hypothetical protein n=1 Tax=Clostridium algoriphilum TaxID=198347 RepID=UPI001CF26E64|nr:hypothetical protein [Clostridium algoriphilum]MCB2294438.1 hypothetical protein [Clostridium algoriphilum]
MGREFVILKLLNLSYPRKLVVNKINNFIFESKLKEIKLNRYQKIIGYTIGIIFLSQQIVYAHPSLEKSNEAIGFLNNYGPPLFLTAGDILKLSLSKKLYNKNFLIPHN